MAWLYQPSRRFGQIIWSVTGRLTVTGQEAMLPYGPLLVASNHLSLNDPGTLVVALPRPVVFLAKKELWEKPIGRFYCNAVGAVPLDRQRGGGAALRYALQALQQDKAILMFPEGTISPTAGLQRGRTGLAWLALKTQAPILPVGIWGSEKFASWHMPVPLARWQVNIGTPFTPAGHRRPHHPPPAQLGHRHGNAAHRRPAARILPGRVRRRPDAGKSVHRRRAALTQNRPIPSRRAPAV